MPRRVGNKELNKMLGLRVREAREANGISQSRLGDLIRATAPTISRLESGHMAPTISTLEAIASVLGVTLSTLFEKTKQPLRARDDANTLTPMESDLLASFKVLDLRSQKALLEFLDASTGPKAANGE